MQAGQALHEYTLEDLRGGVTSRFLARLFKNASGIDAVGDGGIGDLVSVHKVASAAGHPGQPDEAAKDDSLIVGPGGTAVVEAGGVEAIVDPMGLVDHSAGL